MRSGARACVRLVVFVAAIAAPPRARADEPPEVLAELRGVAGTGDVAQLQLGLAGAGLRFALGASLDVHAIVLGLVTRGEAALGAPADGGVGGELGLRVVPWSRARVRPHLAVSLGLLAFPRTPFLPGGDVYEGIITFGLGADVDVVDRWRVGAQLFSVHLSNGQGLGPHNPAYDGFGATIAVAHRLGDPPLEPPADALTEARMIVEPTLRGDAALALGVVDDATIIAARVRAPLRLATGLELLVDVEGGSLAAEAFVEPGVALVGRLGALTAAAHVAYRRFAGIDSAVLTAGADVQITREVALVAMGHHERARDFEPLWRAGVGVRAEPIAALTIDLGIGFDRLGDDTVFGGDHSDPYLGVAWRLPWKLGDQQLALFVERQISTVDLIGLRIERGAPSWRRLR
ncbi:hypothetical protein L6R52_07060 [Myxococcota bacterium]|nr:hypothetical protein [Myxococcota bacterium]